MVLSDGIRSIEIDFDRNILKINGQEVKDETILVTLPGAGGYKYKKLFNMKNEQTPGSGGRIEVCYYEAAYESKERIGKNQKEGSVNEKT